MSQQPSSSTPTSGPPASSSIPAFAPVPGLGMAPTSFPTPTFDSTPISNIGEGMGSRTMQTNSSSSPFQLYGGQQLQGAQQPVGGHRPFGGQPFVGQQPFSVQQSLDGQQRPFRGQQPFGGGQQPIGGQQPFGGQNSFGQSIATGTGTSLTSAYQPMSLPQPIHTNTKAENGQLTHQAVNAAFTIPDSIDASSHRLSSLLFQQKEAPQGMFNQDNQRGPPSLGQPVGSSVSFNNTHVSGSPGVVPKVAEVSNIIDKPAAVQTSAEVQAKIKVEEEAAEPFQNFPKHEVEDDASAFLRRSRRRRSTANRQPEQQPVQKPAKVRKSAARLRNVLSGMTDAVLDDFLANNAPVRTRLEERLKVYHTKTQGKLRGGFADTMENRFEDLKRELREEFGIQQLPTAMPTAMPIAMPSAREMPSARDMPTARDMLPDIVDEGRRLFIGNLAYITAEEEISSFFNGFSIDFVRLPTNLGANRPVYAFVDVSTSEKAERAIVKLSGKEMNDHKVSVQIARQPQASQTTNGTQRDAIVSESATVSGSSSNWLEEAMQDPSLRPRWSAEQLQKLTKPPPLTNDNGKRLLEDHTDEPQAKRARTTSPVKIEARTIEARIKLGSASEPQSPLPMPTTPEKNAESREKRSPSIHPDRLHLQQMEKSFSTLIQYDATNLPPVALQPSFFNPARSFPKGSPAYNSLVKEAIEFQIAKPAVREKVISMWHAGSRQGIEEAVLFAQIAEKYVSTASTMGIDYLEDVFANTEEGTQRFKYETKQYLMALGYRGFNF